MSSQTPVGLDDANIYHEDDSHTETKGLQNDTIDTPLVKSEESENLQSVNVPIGASPPNPIIPMESGYGNLRIGASHPTPIIPRNSDVNLPISAYFPNIIFPEDASPIDITPDKNRGVLKIIKEEGTGTDNPGIGDSVVTHCDIYVAVNGEVIPFEINKENVFTEFSFGRGKMIKGWDLAISTMRKGEFACFIIDPSYAYGAAGFPPQIPPNSTLLLQIKMYDWKPEDLSPQKDGSILRTVLVSGEGSTFPNVGSKVKVQLWGYYNGAIFEERVQEFLLGEGSKAGIPDGIEHALHKFHLNESSIIYLKNEHGSTVEMEQYGIPLKSDVHYKVTLVSFKKAKDVWEMNSDEKYEKAIESREKGIAYTKTGNFKDALFHFKWIVTCLENEPGADPNTVESRNALLLSGYLNISLCHLKLENYKAAITCCDKALKMQPQNEKALFRRGQAKMFNKDTVEAVEDFITVHELYPANKSAKNYISSCKEEISKERIIKREKYKQMFDIFKKQDQERMKNMKTETGVWQDNNEENAEHHHLSETERLIEQNNSLLCDANILTLSSNVCEKLLLEEVHMLK